MRAPPRNNVMQSFLNFARIASNASLPAAACVGVEMCPR